MLQKSNYHNYYRDLYKMYQCVAVGAYVLLQYSGKLPALLLNKVAAFMSTLTDSFSVFIGYSLATSCCRSGWLQMLH